jgi:hypothetical protein
MMNIGWQARYADFQRDKPVAHLFSVGEGRNSRRSEYNIANAFSAIDEAATQRLNQISQTGSECLSLRLLH